MTQTDVDSFRSFGPNFQNCVLQAALIDRDFFEKIFETAPSTNTRMQHD